MSDSEQILFTAATNYLKCVMNGKTTLPIKVWKAERVKLTAERNGLNQRYTALKDKVKEAEQIRKCVTVSCGRNNENSNRKNHGAWNCNPSVAPIQTVKGRVVFSRKERRENLHP